ncbi:hypothetical protein BY458DRAFT_476275 [Sporodiniella umbellata]|nr:hypothetical protein BY458DRAFT_476275 [Sporodiniella umbellata]
MSAPSKKKTSCLNCRSKKIKCNKGEPCQRCESKKIECIYTKPGQVGRPPKNAVVNNFVRTQNSGQFCREFVFENLVTLDTTAAARYLKGSKLHGLEYYLSALFNSFNDRVCNNRQLTKRRLRKAFNVQVSDLVNNFSWMSADLSEIMVQRFSKLRLSQYYCHDFISYVVQADPSSAFFNSSTKELVLRNPLNSIPPDQALRLIDCFFVVHPYSIIVNKTCLLQAYWSDTADPLLLSVVYGTTLFMSQLLEGQPLDMWDTANYDKRNPFLEYAHFLLAEASSEVTCSRYQAVVLLATFEVSFGYAKKSISLFALSYMIVEQLGLVNNTLSDTVSPIEKELILCTFWSVVQCTVRGCIELSGVSRDILYESNYALPPMNALESLSYRLDVQNNHCRSFKHYNYLVESFYIHSVISRLACRALLAFRLDKVEKEIETILGNFNKFIQSEKNILSEFQLISFELHYAFYKMCFQFLRKAKKGTYLGSGIRLPKDLDLSDSETIHGIHQVAPVAMGVVDKILGFLHGQTNSPSNFLSRSTLTSVIDATIKILMYYCILQPTSPALQYLEALETVLSHDTFWEGWGPASSLNQYIKEFLAKNSLQQMTQTSFDWLDYTSLTIDNPLSQSLNRSNFCIDWTLPINEFDTLETPFV